MEKRKFRFQYSQNPAIFRIESVYVCDLEIDFLINGSTESVGKIKQMLHERFTTEHCQHLLPEMYPSAEDFTIIGWSLYEGYSLDLKRGGQGPQ